MNKILKRMIILLLIIGSILIGSNGNPEDFTDQKKLYGLMTIWSEVKFGFPYPEKLETLKWDVKVQEFIPKVLEAKDVDEYYFTLMEFVSLLENSHTSVLPPWGYFKPGYDMPPIEVSILNDSFYISRVGNNKEIVEYELKPGIEILEIDNIPAHEYFKDHVLRYYSQGSKQANEAILPVYILNGPADKKIELKIYDLDKNTREIVLTRNSTNADGSPFLYEFVKNIFVENSITTKFMDNGILYIKIPNFENSQIGTEFQQLIDDTDLTKINGMIVDVRNNMGGSSVVCNQIVECLIDSPVNSPLMTYSQYSAAQKAWGKKQTWETKKNTIKPREGKKYLGPIIVLTNAVTNSTAEDLVIELRYGERAQIVGQTTAGGAGNMLGLDLPFGGRFNLATFKALLPDENEYMGIGVKPDIEIKSTMGDIKNNYDSFLKKSIDVLIGKTN